MPKSEEPIYVSSSDEKDDTTSQEHSATPAAGRSNHAEAAAESHLKSATTCRTCNYPISSCICTEDDEEGEHEGSNQVAAAAQQPPAVDPAVLELSHLIHAAVNKVSKKRCRPDGGTNSDSKKRRHRTGTLQEKNRNKNFEQMSDESFNSWLKRQIMNNEPKQRECVILDVYTKCGMPKIEQFIQQNKRLSLHFDFLFDKTSVCVQGVDVQMEEDVFSPRSHLRGRMESDDPNSPGGSEVARSEQGEIDPRSTVSTPTGTARQRPFRFVNGDKSVARAMSSLTGSIAQVDNSDVCSAEFDFGLEPPSGSAHEVSEHKRDAAELQEVAAECQEKHKKQILRQLHEAIDMLENYKTELEARVSELQDVCVNLVVENTWIGAQRTEFQLQSAKLEDEINLLHGLNAELEDEINLLHGLNAELQTKGEGLEAKCAWLQSMAEEQAERIKEMAVAQNTSTED